MKKRDSVKVVPLKVKHKKIASILEDIINDRSVMDEIYRSVAKNIVREMKEHEERVPCQFRNGVFRIIG